MANNANRDVSAILDSANSGRPLRPIEMQRLAEAAGVKVTSRALRMRLEKVELKLRRLLVEHVGVAAIEETVGGEA